MLTSDRAMAPTTTPRSEPRPPSTTIDRTKSENENSNCPALTAEKYEARNAPATPPNAAPVA